ncbi:MAG: hypothetical protein GC195_18115 [Nostoc sp. RI_552]|nr:hypothetical protein [Nostoc sp. RI_552]
MVSDYQITAPSNQQNKQVQGILAAVDMSVQVREKALQAGLYVARIQDEVKEGQWTREENRTNMENMRLIGY